MSYNKYFKLSILLFAFFILGCENKQNKIDTSGNITPKVEKSIIVYGSESCDHCVDFRKKADSLKIKYTFKDAEANEAYYNELVNKIQQAGIPGYISFPVIDLDGKIYIRPEFHEFLKLLED